MKLKCLKFTSITDAKGFLRECHPIIIEELDIILCGMFSDGEIEIATEEFNARLLATSQSDHLKTN